MALTSPLKLYRRKATGSGTDKFDEVCLDASNFKVTWGGETTTIPHQLEKLQPLIYTLEENDTDHITFNHYLVIWDDGAESDAVPRPRNSIDYDHDLDVFFYSTGITVQEFGDDGQESNFYYYSYPKQSGTFAMTKDIGLTLLDLRGYNA